MLQHPWILLAEYLRENWYTQKDFSKKIWKKTSEINELIRGKRNITVARDIILTKYLSTEPKFWILKQLDYDYEQILLKEQDGWIIAKIDNISSREDKDVSKTNLNDDKTFSYESTTHDILKEEKRQTKYLKENVFQEAPLYEEKNEEKAKNEENNIQNINKNIPIKELLKEDPIAEYTPLSELFDSF